MGGGSELIIFQLKCILKYIFQKEREEQSRVWGLLRGRLIRGRASINVYRLSKMVEVKNGHWSLYGLLRLKRLWVASWPSVAHADANGCCCLSQHSQPPSQLYSVDWSERKQVAIYLKNPSASCHPKRHLNGCHRHPEIFPGMYTELWDSSPSCSRSGGTWMHSGWEIYEGSVSVRVLFQGRPFMIRDLVETVKWTWIEKQEFSAPASRPSPESCVSLVSLDSTLEKITTTWLKDSVSLPRSLIGQKRVFLGSLWEWKQTFLLPPDREFSTWGPGHNDLLGTGDFHDNEAMGGNLGAKERSTDKQRWGHNQEGVARAGSAKSIREMKRFWLFAPRGGR